jgi:hypothetical protein
MDIFEPGLTIRDSLARQQQQLLAPVSTSKRQTHIARELRTIEPPTARPAEEPVNTRRIARELKKKIDTTRYSNLLDDIFANQRATRTIDDRSQSISSAAISHTDERLALSKQLDGKRDIRGAQEKRAIQEYELTQALRLDNKLKLAEEFLVQRQHSLNEAERRRLDAAFVDSVPRGAVIDVEA